MSTISPSVLFNYRNTFVTHFSNGVSAIFCFIALLIVLILTILNGKLNKSISFRLSLLILIGDFFFSVFQILAVHSESNLVCFISTVGFLFTTLISLLYTIAMALNLQLTVIFKFHSGRWMKLALYIVPLLCSLLISILPLAFGQISLAEGSCWFKEWTPLGLKWAYITNYGWIMATIVYCTIVFTSVTFYLIIQRSLFRSSFQGMKSGSLEVKTRTIIKLLMYPLIPIICYTLVLVKLTLAGLGIKLAEEIGYSLDISATFFKGFQGFFNATLFLFNSLLYREARLAFESSVSRKESQRI